MEAMGHAFGAVPFPSAGIGAPHIRDRLYWVAHAVRDGHSTSALRREADSREIRGGLFQSQGRFAEAIECRDGKRRPSQSRFAPWVDGSPEVLGRLRAYGNAINAEAARVFIESYLTTLSTSELD
jgi:DNA (cytosine-5)-methyltransferase 1